MFDIYLDGRLSKEDDMFFLKKYREYSCDKKEKLKFDYSNEPIIGLSDYVPIELLRFNKSEEFEMMIRIMVWVHKFLLPDALAIPIYPFNCINILEKTKAENIKSNCWMYAIVLNEIFLSIGFKSRMVRCMPIDLRFDDCHCVTQAYSDQYNKWILFDASMGTYYTDVNKVPLSISELRLSIIDDKKFFTPFIPSRKFKQVYGYWIKNLFRFETYSCSRFNMESINESKTIYSLIPNDYNIENKKISDRYGNQIQIIYTHDAKQFWEE